MGMERRAASHTEEEEMNQRRKLLNAARRGDTKAIGKLFELYQVRVLSGEQVAKVNKTSTYMAPVPPAKGGRSAASGHSKGTKSATAKPAKAELKQRAKDSVKASDGKPAKAGPDKKHKVKHK
jgi:hypothetical protein